MMKKARLYAWILALGLGLAGRAAGAPDDFVRDVRALTRHAHRQAGREQGSRAAAAHVEQRLRELGLQEIYTQEFPVVQVRMTECVLEADGARIPVYAARPNLLQAVTTPLEGIAGATLYVGDGRIENYGAQSPEGKIVVVDQRCQGRWMTAFAFGAKAVLFVGDPAGAGHPPFCERAVGNTARAQCDRRVARHAADFRRQPHQGARSRRLGRAA